MDYVFMGLAVVLIIVCAYLVITPFFNNKLAVETIGHLDEEKTIEEIYTAVNDLEMDFLMKKISERDFNDMKERYETIATNILSKERANVKKTSKNNKDIKAIDDEIMKELEILRKTR